MKPRTDSRKFKTISRRELLKLTPVLALGAFAIPQLQKPLLKGGLAFSDWASARLFRSGHLAPTFADTDLTPFDRIIPCGIFEKGVTSMNRLLGRALPLERIAAEFAADFASVFNLHPSPTALEASECV